jgi:hypothetical protein
MTSKFWGWLTLLIAAFVFVAVLTHASGFSLAAGTLFSGFNSLGQTLETGGTPATTSKKKS